MSDNYEIERGDWDDVSDIWDYMADYERDLFLEYGPKQDWEQLFDQMPHHRMSYNVTQIAIEFVAEDMFKLETQAEIDDYWEELWEIFDSWEDFWTWFREKYSES